MTIIVAYWGIFDNRLIGLSIFFYLQIGLDALISIGETKEIHHESNYNCRSFRRRSGSAFHFLRKKGHHATGCGTRAKGKEDSTIWWKVTVWGEQFDKMIPYFKKGSPIIVVGDLNMPEIFTDRDGKAQVSMSLTALNLMFSPFGRPEGHAQEGHGAPNPEYAFAGAAEQPMAHGQGKMPASFAEDEIPF